MPSEIADLENLGVLSVIDKDSECIRSDNKTLVILGCPRGGTSAIAGALHRLGVHMGPGAAAPVFEALVLARDIEQGNTAAAESTIRGLDAEHNIWGFKRPGFAAFTDDYHHIFRNPIYLIIMRDAAATVSRGLISGRLKNNPLKKLQKTLRVYSDILNFVETFGAHSVFISYEKLVASPDMVLGEILRCISVSVSDEKLRSASDFIKPSPSSYLEMSRAHRTVGEWTNVNGRVILGWVSYVNKTMRGPVKIILYDGESEVASQIANMELTTTSFPDCENRKSGFKFDLAVLKLRSTHLLRVRALNDINDVPAVLDNRESGLSSLLRKLGLRKSRTNTDVQADE